MRKLASVQKIWKIEPIEGADRIELASVMGWKCVVPKGMYRIGENVVYFEIDSFLPVRPEYEFLRKSSYKKSEILGEGFRIKTQTMRGALSQGLVMKLGDLGIAEDTPVKTDLTKTLGSTGVGNHREGDRCRDNHRGTSVWCAKDERNKNSVRARAA